MTIQTKFQNVGRIKLELVAYESGCKENFHCNSYFTAQMNFSTNRTFGNVCDLFSSKKFVRIMRRVV